MNEYINEQKKNTYADKALIAKNGDIVPSLINGNPVHSLYDPQKEALRIAQTAGGGFAVCIGLGGAYHIRSFLERQNAIHMQTKVIVIEKTRTDFEMLFSQVTMNDLLCDNRIEWFALEDENNTHTFPARLYELICNLYFPAVYGTFTVLPLRPWTDMYPAEANAVQAVIQKALEAVSRDYSVQAHFGKVWQRNIFSNLRFCAYIFEEQHKRFAKKSSVCSSYTDTGGILHQKKAVVVAAGPSLDTSWQVLSEKRDMWYIIATDTALPALSAHGIAADAFVSIDGQNISYLHVMSPLHENTLAVIDLCAHPEIARRAYEAGCRVLFTRSAHPLCTLADSYACAYYGLESFFPVIETSSGTVTLAAYDFARKAGFQNISVIAADFAFSNGKPYTKATYLDSLYDIVQNRCMPLETQFCTLMLRTPLIEAYIETGYGQALQQIKTSSVLASYKREMELFLENHRGAAALAVLSENKKAFPYIQFLDYVLHTMYSFQNDENRSFGLNDKNRSFYMAFLPFAAYTAKKNLYFPQKNDVFLPFKLANDCITRYNKSL